MALQDVVMKRPITPMQGETYEGLYILPDGNVNIFMESVFDDKQEYKWEVKDLVTGETRGDIKPD